MISAGKRWRKWGSGGDFMPQVSPGLTPGANPGYRDNAAHAHDDYPERDDANWMKHTLAWCGNNGAVRLDYRPVKMQTLTNDVAVFPPKKRVY